LPLAVATLGSLVAPTLLDGRADAGMDIMFETIAS
jgi:hypothetical protein